MGDKASNPSDWLSKDAPPDLKDFLGCTKDAVTLKAGKLTWIGAPIAPDLTIEPDETDQSKGTLTIGADGFGLSFPASVDANGQLSIDTSSVPSLTDDVQRAKDAINRFTKNANDWFKDHGKQLGTPIFVKGQVRLVKVPLVAQPMSTATPTTQPPVATPAPGGKPAPAPNPAGSGAAAGAGSAAGSGAAAGAGSAAGSGSATGPAPAGGSAPTPSTASPGASGPALKRPVRRGMITADLPRTARDDILGRAADLNDLRNRRGWPQHDGYIERRQRELQQAADDAGVYVPGPNDTELFSLDGDPPPGYVPPPTSKDMLEQPKPLPPEPGLNIDPPYLAPVPSPEPPKRTDSPVAMGAAVGGGVGSGVGAAGDTSSVAVAAVGAAGTGGGAQGSGGSSNARKIAVVGGLVLVLAIGAVAFGAFGGGSPGAGSGTGAGQTTAASVAPGETTGGTADVGSGETAGETQLPTSAPATVACDPAPPVQLTLSGSVSGTASPACIPAITVPNRGSATPFCRLQGIPNPKNTVAGVLNVAVAFLVGDTRYELNLAYVADERDATTHGVLPATIVIANGSSGAGQAAMTSWPDTEAIPAGDQVGWQPVSGTVTFGAAGDTGGIDLDFTSHGQTVHVAGIWTVAMGCPAG